VTVLAVDDQPVFLRAAHALIDATPGFEQVGEAGSGPEALEKAAALRPDLVLLDVRMPGMDGIETARRLADTAGDAVLVLISLEAVPELPAATVAAHVRKQDLSVRTLQELWAAHSPRRRLSPSAAHGRASGPGGGGRPDGLHRHAPAHDGPDTRR
jgi:DNA-binding NarL/FixJ family response regulator